jgi:hypothetical protein
VAEAAFSSSSFIKHTIDPASVTPTTASVSLNARHRATPSLFHR